MRSIIGILKWSNYFPVRLGVFVLAAAATFAVPYFIFGQGIMETARAFMPNLYGSKELTGDYLLEMGILCLIAFALFSFVEDLNKDSKGNKGRVNVACNIEFAISALREIQVKSLELPSSCRHDADVIGVLAVQAEEILCKEKESKNAH